MLRGRGGLITYVKQLLGDLRWKMVDELQRKIKKLRRAVMGVTVTYKFGVTGKSSQMHGGNDRNKLYSWLFKVATYCCTAGTARLK